MKKFGLITIHKKGRNTKVAFTKKGLLLHQKIKEIRNLLCSPKSEGERK